MLTADASQNIAAHDAITTALEELDQNNPRQTDGHWLEDATASAGPHIKEWDIAVCWSWADWPERELYFPGTTGQDIGIDAVAIRRSDGRYIAIQCKARQLDANSRGANIAKSDMDKFTAASAHEFWAERWLVTNGDNRISGNASQVAAMSAPERPIKLVNIHADLVAQQNAAPQPEPCPHCAPDAPLKARQTRQCMQDEAVADSVRILQEHEQSDSGGLPVGQARGKIILPCGTGKTRISLKIMEELTPPGQLSIVLCPSIALVAQIRREYLQHAVVSMRALAVCSDETAGYAPKKESTRNTATDPTLDNSNVSATEVKGQVTTDPAEITRWIRNGQDSSQISVIFGTYQSGHRIAAALRETGATVQVLIADEAHRTAGLRRNPKTEQRFRDFTLCHDNDAFPAIYRVYQTATPRIYDTRKVNRDQPSDWIVRTMDDETIFGVELYRKSYQEAVDNGWLADYRIIALGINDPASYAAANLLAANTKSKGRRALTTHDYLRGLTFALAMGSATRHPEHGDVPIKSCIAFMNTVDKSKNMADDLQSATVQQWLQEWMSLNRDGQPPAPYRLEHLDATSNVATRDNAKRKLAAASAPDASPHGIINVGIFGEGTDSPSLNAVAFLEARKSPIDVIQAVGRAMRTAPGKKLGYIICPIYIPPNKDPETHLSVSAPEEGWQELGQILLALRAHDQRIEDNLSELMHLYLPQPPETEHTLVAVAAGPDRRISYREHVGPPGEAQRAVTRALEGKSALAQEFRPVGAARVAESPANYEVFPAASTPDATLFSSPPEPTQIITGKKNHDGSNELRIDTIVRGKPGPDGAPGPVDLPKSKAKAKDMINQGTGTRLPEKEPRHRLTRAERADQAVQQALQLMDWKQHGNAITVNLLTKSGLTANRMNRDLNILENSIREATHHLAADELRPELDRHFGLNNLKADDSKKQADGCTIATLLLMNAAMLHQRIANGQWLPGVSDLDTIKNSANVISTVTRQWNAIIGYDFKPILEPAVKVIYAIEDTGKRAGLERALRHIAAEAERIAETYADMGADHAGQLFNKVMGNQASDGAYFTRPVAASIAARLTLDAAEETADTADWTDPAVWREHKTVDLACGSGTLLAAMLAEMKRRARAQGAPEAKIARLHKLAVEEILHGLDINPVSLQLAASQLTAGNQDIRYHRMGLHLMPYGHQAENPAQVSAGSLELLGQKAIVSRNRELNLADAEIASQAVWNQHNDALLEGPVDAARDARIVIMNPPFTSREKMGKKFPKPIQAALRSRVDDMERLLARNDPTLQNFADKHALGPLFVALADKCLNESRSVLTMIHPTIALTNSSGQDERMILAQRYHIHTVLTCHQPKQINLSQKTSVNESIIVAQRHDGPKPDTRFINLDRFPIDDAEVEELHECLARCSQGAIHNGWGEISWWPAERIIAGDWTPAVWRSPKLAEAAARFANDANLPTINETGLRPASTGPTLRNHFERAIPDTPGSFPILKSKGTGGQTHIKSQPDEVWIPKKRDESIRQANGGTYPEAVKILAKASHLLITAGQDNSTGRVTATADDTAYVGNGWIPVTGLSAMEARALAVFINATPGRLQLMRNPGKKLAFPGYSTTETGKIRIPDIKNDRIRQILADCWERTKDALVPQFRDSEYEVRCLWDEAVATAMGWDAGELAQLRQLLHQEPHVLGLGYNQYADEIKELAVEQSLNERFLRLVDEWKSETAGLSSPRAIAGHSAYQQIIAMGEPALPLIFRDLKDNGGWWYPALRALTGENPVPEYAKGKPPLNDEAWLHWGRKYGYI